MPSTEQSPSQHQAVDGAFISKSKYLWGLQCHKLLWHAHNAKERIAKTDAATEATFDQGYEVGALARQMFPGGYEVGDGIILDIDAAIKLIQEALKMRKPLFEAVFAAEGGVCR